MLKIPEKIKPYKGILLFVIILLAANYFWKFTMLGDESDELVTFFGHDVSAPFNLVAAHVARMATYFLDMAGYDVALDKYNIIRHDNGLGIRIVWACTGLKQAYIFLMIMLFSPGPFLKKLWFIPAGLFVVYLFNIFRIVFIISVIKFDPVKFDFLHAYVFKYIFYGVIFLMWVLWEEKIRKKRVEN